MKRLRTGDHVSFVCDECEEYSPLAYEAYRKLKSANPQAAQYMGTYASEDEKKCQPLQAADAVIYEIRKLLNIASGKRKEGLRKQFSVLAGNKVMFFIQTSNREQLLRVIATHKPGEPFKLDEIMNQEFTEDIQFGT